jgi:hypothetical protein
MKVFTILVPSFLQSTETYQIRHISTLIKLSLGQSNVSGGIKFLAGTIKTTESNMTIAHFLIHMLKYMAQMWFIYNIVQ